MFVSIVVLVIAEDLIRLLNIVCKKWIRIVIYTLLDISSIRLLFREFDSLRGRVRTRLFRFVPFLVLLPTKVCKSPVVQQVSRNMFPFLEVVVMLNQEKSDQVVEPPFFDRVLVGLFALFDQSYSSITVTFMTQVMKHKKQKTSFEDIIMVS